jgi:lipopolysaccharide transport system ATP-binding protein
MSDIVIRAEGLGKKYLIGHQAERERYTALRDVIARSARGLVRSAADMLRGRSLVAGDAVEEFWALRDVSFEVKRGEVVGIIGRNGAGKSTLLKVLSRITEPSAGRVIVTGRVASLLEVGTGFHPELTGRENIFLNGAILGMTRSEIRRKFDEIVAFAEIERFLDTPVKRYSSGMYVRLAFAVAAHLEPEILIVDEVLAVGDAEFQRKCLGKMGEVASAGRTVLLVSHNLAAVSALCGRGLLLEGGRLVLLGSAQEIIERYADASTEACNITFSACSNKPSITRVTVDSEALKHRRLQVKIGFESPWPLPTPIGGIVLRAAGGEPVWGSNGRFHTHGRQARDIAEGVLMCEAHDIPLVSGHYLISVWLADWYTDHDSKIDVLRIIVGNDQSELLRPPTSVNGHLDWPAIWHVDACCLGQTVQPSRVPVEAIPDTSGGRRAVSR